MYVMVLSIHDGIVFMMDLTEGDLSYVDIGQFQKRFYIEDMEIQEFPKHIREQPVENLFRDKNLLQDSLKILMQSPVEGSLLIMGSEYIMDVNTDGTFILRRLVDFPDSLEQHGLFQKYDLEYFYNHKNTISQNVKLIYDKMRQNFIDNLDHIRNQWETFSKDPMQHLGGIKDLLVQYHEKTTQCEELKDLLKNMYSIWKQLSAEHDLLEVQETPINIEQNIAMNNRRQLLYRKLDKIKWIEKHATDLLVKIHIICTCLMFYIHIIACEIGKIHYRLDSTVELQKKIQQSMMRINTISAVNF
jgi:hypothetical protein